MDVTAIEKAVAYYSSMFRRTCLNAQRMDVEELEQDIRIKLYSVTPNGKLHPHAFYMHTAYYEYLHFRRSFIRRTSRVVPLTKEPVVVQRTVEHADVTAFVDAMPDGRDKAICRLYFGGMRRSDIARLTGLSNERVSQILRAAMLPLWKGTSQQ